MLLESVLRIIVHMTCSIQLLTNIRIINLLILTSGYVLVLLTDKPPGDIEYVCMYVLY